MIPTRLILFDGAILETPLIGGYCMEFMADTFEEYGTYCGPGKFGDIFVPDNFFGLHMGAVCHIHDVTRAVIDKTEEEFNQCDRMFHENMCRAIHAKIEDVDYRIAALHQAADYYGAVNKWGKKYFFKEKAA